MKDLTREQAIKLYESGVYENWSDEEIVKFQLFQDRLCIPFGRFHEAIETVLGRPVYTHEFGSINLLREEYEGFRPKPTLEEVINMIPEEKRIIFKINSRVDDKI